VSYVQELIEKVKEKNPNEPEFLQTVDETLVSIEPVLNKNPKIIKAKVLERLVEPERQIIFRVPWIDNNGEIQINRGYRIQFNSAIGPYKGGLRFHPTVNLSIMKFLSLNKLLKIH